MMSTRLLVVFVGLLATASAANLTALEAAFSYLQSKFNTSAGTYSTTGWWNSANIQELTLDFISYIRKSGQTPKTDWEGLFKKNLELTYKLHSSSSFLNSYYDDEGWWALAWVKAYDVFKNNTYLQMARIIFQDMTRGWDESVCNGGVWWDKKKTYKNAIPNELFMSLATKLYLRTNETGFYDWAMKAYSWFYHTGMLNAQWLINDGLDSSKPQSCVNNKGITWSYNQGVILGALVDFAVIQKNNAMIAIGQKIIDATLVKLVSSSVLIDKCELDDQGKQKDCGADGSQFKGIFMKYLAYFCENSKSSATKYANFAERQANIIEAQNSHNDGSIIEFGLHYVGPFDKADASRQSSALDAIISSTRISQAK